MARMKRPLLAGASILVATLAGAFIMAPAPAADFVRLEGGTFRMGQEGTYREEMAVREVTVGAFLISSTEITNADFADFVEATGYVTVAERGTDPA